MHQWSNLCLVYFCIKQCPNIFTVDMIYDTRWLKKRTLDIFSNNFISQY